MATSAPRSNAPVPPDASARHRSGAVARMLQMPVATLRVWERRYGVAQPERSASGQRLYSADDVRRLALLKQLTEHGHAIGSLAALDMAQLQQVAATHARTLAARQPAALAAALRDASVPVWRLAVIGPMLARRVQRPAVRRQIGARLSLLGPFDSIEQAATLLKPDAVDALLLHEPELHRERLEALESQAGVLARLPRAVVFGFGPEPAVEAWADAGAALLREPQPDVALGQWLRTLPQALSHVAAVMPASAAAEARAGSAREPAAAVVPPRRWDDRALADVAGLSSTIACECPRHVAELLMQLSQFEAYCASCETRSPADAQLHADLRQVAGSARAGFELALERVALHEGLILPIHRDAGA